jgi:hypothetical protein
VGVVFVVLPVVVRCRDRGGMPNEAIKSFSIKLSTEASALGRVIIERPPPRPRLLPWLPRRLCMLFMLFIIGLLELLSVNNSRGSRPLCERETTRACTERRNGRLPASE